MSRFVRSLLGLPNPDEGFAPTSLAASRVGGERPRVFDPALAHFAHGFRPGDPTIADPADAARWVGLRRLATDFVLRRIAESRWGSDLVLRGSRLQRAWFGERAREPGDLDWIVGNPTAATNGIWATGFLRSLSRVVLASGPDWGGEFVANAVATDSIWTYDRAEGRRIVFPWRAEGLPGGMVQVDVVFREAMAEPARVESIPVADGGCVTVRAATPAQSLAWKLLWLASDIHPQGKDLYDAVLLAEHWSLTYSTYLKALEPGDWRSPPATLDELLADWSIDWDNFRLEYPWIEGDEAGWLARLRQAIAPTFGMPAPPVPGPVDPPWLTPTVRDLAAGIAEAREWDALPILADALIDAGCDRPDLVAHCQARGPHSGGCWAVDRVLGRGAVGLTRNHVGP